MRLVITDNDGGSFPRILNHTFEPYATTKTRGTESGLAMVKKIMDGHGACIELRNRQSSTTSGTSGTDIVGVQVSILFVKLAQRGRQSRRTQRKSIVAILVIDDEMGIRELLSKTLGDEGYVVEVAENAQHACKHRASTIPDLVLLDIWMPDIGGVTLLKEWTPQGLLAMPVTMVLGYVTIDTAVEVAKTGALNFLGKPITLQGLLTAVEQGLSHSKERPRSATPVIAPVVGPAGAMSNAAAAGTPAVLECTDTDGVPIRAAENGDMQFSFDMPLREARDLFEHVYLEYHLQHEGDSMVRVIEETGLERIHLYRKFEQLDVELSCNKGEPTA